ncbi:FYN-binding protein 1 isoform X2 [Triplophysa dalaica]|uniref:FYN-binding protein 1 isoform X2 n=1 Tax=Triplophysa dalaica TaxID=1582913 RepID=UPI0024DFE9B8|nr:FYN-binding protein 1 isoform X2 [Triplophysa dalaica]
MTMDNKSDVKAIMARFQAGSASVEGSPPVRPKPPVQPTLSSGSSVHVKKPLESTLSGGATTTSSPKPNFLKSTVNTVKSAPDLHDAPKTKAFVGRFENTQENNKANFKVPFKPKPPDSTQDSEPKVTFPKVALHKPSPIGMANDSKGMSPKPLATTVKPPWVREQTKAEDNSSSPNPAAPKMKPKSTMALIQQQHKESTNAEPAEKSTSVSNVKPSSFCVKNSFNKPEEIVKEGVKASSSQESVPKPVTLQKPTFPKKTAGPPAQSRSDDPSAPKKKPLLNSFALGNAPAKPNRPPKVNLEQFKKGTETATESPAPKNVTPPPPPASHPSNQVAPPLPSQPYPPILPPRPTVIQDENYDDVDCVRGGKNNDGSGSDGEIYEDLDDTWSAAESSQAQKKQDKAQDLKNQKEREKKEKEAIKKFKLTPPLKVIHQVKAKADCRGGKNDLSVKKGESIDIIRINDNPEGKWVGRGQDGSFGFVKTEMVEINFSVLKNQGLSIPITEELYDDVGSQDDHGNTNGQRVVLPPPPDDVYDDITDPNLNPISTADNKFSSNPRNFLEMLKISVDRRKSQLRNESFLHSIPPPAQFTPEGNKDNSPDGEIYDDVDHPCAVPPPPPAISFPQTKSKTKLHDDPKKQKKFEKEEKDFRKKFKYDGEIHVLHQVTVASGKKGSGKDLPVQAGEILDVISKSDPDKFICRNKEGKFGYVALSNIQQDEEVYDDIGDDCIYDND